MEVVAICERNRGWAEKGWSRVGIKPFPHQQGQHLCAQFPGISAWAHTKLIAFVIIRNLDDASFLI